MWAPYPPLFPALHRLLVKALAGDSLPLLVSYFFEADRSTAAIEAHERVLARLELAWQIGNAGLLLAIALVVQRLAKSRLAGAAFLLLQIVPGSRMRLGIGNDQFDYLPALLTIGGVSLVAQGRLAMAGMVGGLGGITKIFPLLLVPIAWGRARSLRDAALPAVAGAVVVALGVAPFLIADPKVFLSTWRWSGERGGWESVWLFPEKVFPPMPSPSGIEALFGTPLPSSIFVLEGGRTIVGDVVAEESDAVVVETAAGEVRIARADIHGQGERKKAPLPLRLLALAAFAVAAVVPLLFRGRDPARVALLSLLALLVLSPGVSSYFVLWFVPLLFVVHRPPAAAALTAAFVLLANVELHRWPDVPHYWPALFARHALLVGLALVQVRALRGEVSAGDARA